MLCPHPSSFNKNLFVSCRASPTSQRCIQVVQATVVQGSYVPPNGNRPNIQMGQPIVSSQAGGKRWCTVDNMDRIIKKVALSVLGCFRQKLVKFRLDFLIFFDSKVRVLFLYHGRYVWKNLNFLLFDAYGCCTASLLEPHLDKRQTESMEMGRNRFGQTI